MSNLYEVAAEVLKMPVDEINDETTPKNTKAWDSLKHVELLMACEMNFDVKLAPSEIVLIDSIGGIRSLLEEKGVTSAA
jgi:acyl carrier protein